MDHSNADKGLNRIIKEITYLIKCEVEFSINNNTRVTAKQIVETIFRATYYPRSLVRGVVSHWFDEHSTLALYKGHGGGVTVVSNKGKNFK